MTQTAGAADKIVLFGGSQALFNLAVEIQRRGYDLLICTEDLHLGETINRYGSLEDNLTREKLPYINLPKISPRVLRPHVTPNTLGLSICALWIFKQETINLFRGRLYNIHSSVLPKGRGGGGHTWKILAQDRSGGFTIHEVAEGIDTGDTVMVREFDFPAECRIPKHYYEYAQRIEDRMLMEFLDAIENGRPLVPMRQDSRAGTYWPRINTAINGYIDWSWTVGDIRCFIDAFDDPYSGASTYWNARRIRLKKCDMIPSQEQYHPFQYGIVFRIHEDCLYVAANGGCLMIRDVFDEDGNHATRWVCHGDRFFTPHTYLDQAKCGKIVYTSAGLKVK